MNSFMSRRKLKKDDRRWLKKAGFRREHGALAGLACALHEAEQGTRPDGYVLQADCRCGERTRRRVRRERWNRQWRCVRRMGGYVLVFGGSLAAFLLLVHAAWVMISD